jgi:hypothetical protein
LHPQPCRCSACHAPISSSIRRREEQGHGGRPAPRGAEVQEQLQQTLYLNYNSKSKLRGKKIHSNKPSNRTPTLGAPKSSLPAPSPAGREKAPTRGWLFSPRVAERSCFSHVVPPTSAAWSSVVADPTCEHCLHARSDLELPSAAPGWRSNSPRVVASVPRQRLSSSSGRGWKNQGSHGRNQTHFLLSTTTAACGW